MPGAINLQGSELSMEMSIVFILGGGHADDAPGSLLTVVIADQHRQQLPDVEAVGLGALRATIHFDAGRVDHEILDVVGQEVAMEPEAITASLIATEDTSRSGQSEALLGQADFRLQGQRVACVDSALARALPRPDGEAKLPIVDTEFEG